MMLASWNITSLNMPHKQDEVREFIFANKISLLCLNETQVRYSSSVEVCKFLPKGWRVLNNFIHHQNGRICVVWDYSVVDVTLVGSVGFVDCKPCISLCMA